MLSWLEFAAPNYQDPNGQKFGNPRPPESQLRLVTSPRRGRTGKMELSGRL